MLLSCGHTKALLELNKKTTKISDETEIPIIKDRLTRKTRNNRPSDRSLAQG